MCTGQMNILIENIMYADICPAHVCVCRLCTDVLVPRLIITYNMVYSSGWVGCWCMHTSMNLSARCCQEEWGKGGSRRAKSRRNFILQSYTDKQMCTEGRRIEKEDWVEAHKQIIYNVSCIHELTDHGHTQNRRSRTRPGWATTNNKWNV